MSRISETMYIAVLYKSIASKQYHVNQCLKEGGTYAQSYNSAIASAEGNDFKYYYINGTHLGDIINNLRGAEFNSVVFLPGEYEAEVINYVLTRVRRKAV